jgi:hypothetical protein
METGRSRGRTLSDAPDAHNGTRPAKECNRQHPHHLIPPTTMVGGQQAVVSTVVMASPTVADWITAAGTVGATVVALALGLGVNKWLLRPRLVPILRRERDSSLLITGSVGIPGIGAVPIRNVTAYLRLYIRNRGRSSTTDVRVALVKVEVWSDARSQWEEYKQELGGREFVWSNSNPVDTVRSLARKSERTVDIFYIERNKPAKGLRPLTLRLGGEPPGSEAHIFDPPGAWRLTLELSGKGAATVNSYVSFRYDGGWTTTENRDFWNVLAVDGPSPRRQHEPPVVLSPG